MSSDAPRTQTVSIGHYLDELTTGVSDGWNRFWFTPTDPATLGLVRVLTGLMLVYTHWVWGLQFDTFFGMHSWTSAEVVRQFQQHDFAFSFWWAVPPHLALTVHDVCLGLLIAFTLGIFTRLSSIAALVIVISYAHRVPTALFGLDQINGMLALYCAIGPSGRAYSVDNLLRRWRQGRLGGRLGGRVRSAADGPAECGARPSIGANVAIRLIQLHMCLIYFFAGIAKLQGETWWNGLAMWYSFANREYQTMNMTWLAESPWVINAMTHVTILFEIGFCVLIWPRLSRPLMLLLAVLLHLGIGLCLGMWTFGLVMLIGCASFLPPHLVRQLVRRRV